jgi:hypothetical protein
MDIQNEAQCNTYNLNQGLMDKLFFDNYISVRISSGCKKKCDKILEDNDFIEYYSIGIKSDRIDYNSIELYYNELWFLDINLNDNKYLPVFIENINTSSYYSLSRCSMDNDDDNYKTIDEILELCPVSSIPNIKNIINKFT